MELVAAQRLVGANQGKIVDGIRTDDSASGAVVAVDQTDNGGICDYMVDGGH